MSQSAHESIPDWMLMAYADGELEPHEREAVAAYVAGNMAAAERMAGFQRSGRALGRLYDRSLREPVPDHLVDLVRGARLRHIPVAPFTCAIRPGSPAVSTHPRTSEVNSEG